MDNYPDDIRSFDDNPNSPFYDDGGFEDAVTAKYDEIIENVAKHAEEIAERVADLSEEDNVKFYQSLVGKDKEGECTKHVAADILEKIIEVIAEGKVEEEREA